MGRTRGRKRKNFIQINKKMIRRKSMDQLQILQRHYQTKKQSFKNEISFDDNLVMFQKEQIRKISQQTKISTEKVYKWFWERKRKDDLIMFQIEENQNNENYNSKIEQQNNQNIEQHYKYEELSQIRYLAPEKLISPTEVIIPSDTLISQKGMHVLSTTIWQFTPIKNQYYVRIDQESFSKQQKQEQMI